MREEEDFLANRLYGVSPSMEDTSDTAFNYSFHHKIHLVLGCRTESCPCGCHRERERRNKDEQDVEIDKDFN